MRRRPHHVRVRAGQFEFVKLNTKKSDLRDAYHLILTLSWPWFSALIFGIYLLINVVFASLYLLQPHAIAEMRPGSFLDAFFFSVETLATVHETRIIRLLEVFLHAGNNLGGWSAKYIHQVILQSFQISEKAYGLNQLRYDLRKLKGHGLLERDGSRYAYRLTSKGFQVALLFLFFHKRLCGPLANSRFPHPQTPTIAPRANLKLPIIRPTGPSKTLSISSMLRDTAACKSSTNYVYDFGGKNL